MSPEVLLRLFYGLNVDSLELVQSCEEYRWFLYAVPNHETFWKAFFELFPGARELAGNYGANIDGVFCPEFERVEDLLDWFQSVTGLELTFDNEAG